MNETMNWQFSICDVAMKYYETIDTYCSVINKYISMLQP